MIKGVDDLTSRASQVKSSHWVLCLYLTSTVMLPFWRRSSSPDTALSGLVGVYVTVPKVPKMLNMLDWACLAPSPKTDSQSLMVHHCHKAPPAATSAISTPPYLSDRVPGAVYK